MERKVQFYRFNSEDGKLTREQGPLSSGTPIPAPKTDGEKRCSRLVAEDFYFYQSLDLLLKRIAFSLRMEEQFPRAPITPPPLCQRLSARLWDLRRRIANWIYPIDDDEDY